MKKNLIPTILVAVLFAVTGCRTSSVSSSQSAPEPRGDLSSRPVSSGNLPGGTNQVSTMSLAEKIVAYRKTDAALLKEYSWYSRTELIDGEKVKDLRIYLVSFGLNGQLKRHLINDPSAPLPRAFIQRPFAEDERERVEKYLNGLRGLLDEYTLPMSDKVNDFVSRARISAPDANGLLEISGASVVMPGDAFNLWVDRAKCQTRKIQITTTFDQDTVELTATFVTLPSGLTHVEFAEVDVPAKALRLQVQNSGYNQNN